MEEKIIFVPGLPAMKFLLAKKLINFFGPNIFWVDPKGDPEKLLKIVEKLNVNTVIAFSEGAITTLKASFLRPQQFRKMVLINPGFLEGTSKGEYLRRVLKTLWYYLARPKRYHLVTMVLLGILFEFIFHPREYLKRTKGMLDFDLQQIPQSLREKILLIYSQKDSLVLWRRDWRIIGRRKMVFGTNHFSVLYRLPRYLKRCL